ncbi:GGDEF domain-containing protein [Porticoccus sp. W117]|uniref:sensor domain-containing diguanylate cyclase n=1 Tax=Porticoccus sp. W117 TaxID=3054777 RepID=UPI0025944670|nr:GGDEF domain-containing protein [Porticoccus sp. W117]MDM3869879.1 GGDEF domain-containing protein [Porticoccus sp. W117]
MNPTAGTATNEKNERELLLQRIGVELSYLAAKGIQDSKLENILEHLRIVLRERVSSDDEGLTKVSTMLFGHLKEMPDSDQVGTNIQPLAEALQALLQEMRVPMANYSDAQKIAVSAARAKSQDEIVEVLQRGLKLLRTINESSVDSASPKAASDSSKGKSRGWLKRSGSKADNSARDIFDALRPVLDKVLDNLASLDDVSRQVVVIKAELPTVNTTEGMQHILQQVLELLGGIARSIGIERRDTEQFLGQLREKLQGIEQGIVGTLDKGSLSRAEQLQNNIGEQVSDIQQAVAGENTLDGLRQLIETRVEKIGNTLDEYLNDEQEKHRQSERQVRDLTRKLREMELQGQQLRAKVHEKQAAASKDTLTGVLNRFGYEERVIEEFSRSRRIGFPLTMMVVDVDKFKTVNDTYGHKAGDLVLQKVVETLSSSIRKTDCLARFGGDEFVLLLPDTDAEGARVVAEKARAGVEKCGFHSGGQPVNVTISCGITEVQDEDTPESAFERADQGMYKAKRNNRNSSVVV